jgi:hypothetical protein
MWISPRRWQSAVLSLLSQPVDVAAPHRASLALDSVTPFALLELECIPDRAGEVGVVESGSQDARAAHGVACALCPSS